MKRNVCSILVMMIASLIYAQDFDSFDLKMISGTSNRENVKPSDIPDENVMRMMGLSELQIQEALDFKFSGRKFVNGVEDTIQNNILSSSFSNEFVDTIVADTTTYPKARIYGQDIFRNNELSFFQKALDAKAPENYKVGPGDEISIAVWGYSEFSETLLVDDRGYINPSSYGRIYVKGLSFKKMRAMLKSKFSSFLDMKNSEIDVTLSYSRVITVNIVGEVYNPGSYSIPAINTAFNALIAAKGPNQLGTVRNIYIKRSGKTVDSLDVYQFLFNPTRSQDIYLQDGDYLFVPPAKIIVDVNGAINRPYTYEAKIGESVADILQYAGGFTIDAFLDVVTLKRKEYNDIKVYDVYKDHFNSAILQNGDNVTVNQISNTISNIVSVKGSVGVQGDYEYKKGERLLDLLNRAKCIDEKTFLEKVYIVRLNKDRTKSHLAVNLQAILEDETHDDNILLQEYDIIRVLSIEDFDDEYSISIIGAVRSPGDIDFGEGMSLQDALLQGGGLTRVAEQSRIEIFRVFDYNISDNRLIPKRAKVKTVRIKNNLLLSKEAREFLLKPQDQIFVRENPNFIVNEKVLISGEVAYPGVYSLLRKGEKVSSLINRAGGLTEQAFLDGVHMERSMQESPSDTFFTKSNVIYLNLEKALNNLGSKYNIELKDLDVIHIPANNNLVRITGALAYYTKESISAPIANKRAHYYVKNYAGGYGVNNEKSNTVVTYANGVTKKTKDFGLFTISPKVKKGSTVIVYNKEIVEDKDTPPFDVNKFLEKSMTKASALLTLLFLIQRFQQ